MLELGLKVLIAYLLGSLNGSLVLGKVLGWPDVRTVGSGNAGGTNALRAHGKWFAVGVVVIDVVKGVVAATTVPALALVAPESRSLGPEFTQLACAGAAVVGHCYPLWFGFQGGKGGATGIGALIGLAPWLLIPALLTWYLVVAASGFVGLATMSVFAVLPVAAFVRGVNDSPAFIVFLVLLALFVAWTHRSNIERMRQRQETRMTGIMWRRPAG
ncbi:MAG: glycerol-3-phosphate 1-O-acyltransferase PlsY [Gammaproteobacteria bacterium]|nr:glycerol-3-phosphate 1-O-acyltransferase PlsY [Gammaproteobacteria bacterium]